MLLQVYEEPGQPLPADTEARELQTMLDPVASGGRRLPHATLLASVREDRGL